MDSDIREYLERSVLCWLATTSTDHTPNVSPKEAFMPYGDDIIIAQIASPQTVKNIRQNRKACLSFIDIFTQKGYQLKGEAQIITSVSPEYEEMKSHLETLTMGKYPYASIIRFNILSAKRIIAPSYTLYPDTTEQDQILDAMRSYGISALKKSDDD